MKKKIKINWKYALNITIALAIVFGIGGYVWWYSKLDSSTMNDIKIDAHRLITVAESMHRSFKSTGEEKKCYPIEIKEDQKFYHENAHNYIGSVSFESDKPLIWLSDGEFFLHGTNHNFEITRSNLEASTEC